GLSEGPFFCLPGGPEAPLGLLGGQKQPPLGSVGPPEDGNRPESHPLVTSHFPPHVLFHDPTFTMGQVLRRVALGRSDQILFRCVQSMPPKVEKAYNSCYSGGVFHLQQGDRLSLSIPRFNASFDISTHGTFLGVLRL
uniref:THD domain-containing protein n=1 Tax=Pseudonaja textilis TaxID=8673 RepID=A0A670ZKB5_PSETE